MGPGAIWRKAMEKGDRATSSRGPLMEGEVPRDKGKVRDCFESFSGQRISI